MTGRHGVRTIRQTAAKSYAVRRWPPAVRQSRPHSLSRYIPCWAWGVIRVAAVLSMVLALTAAPVVAHLCDVRCSPQAAGVTDCHPAGASAALRAAGQDGCDDFVEPAHALPEAVRRAAAGPTDDAALVAAPLDAPAVGRFAGLLPRHPAVGASLEKPPLLTTLRI